MSTDTDTAAASTQSFCEYIRSDPKVLNMTGKRKRSTYLQVNWDQFVKNFQNMASWDSYKDAHKQATLIWQESKKVKSSSIVTSKPLTIRHIVWIVNLTHLALPSDCEVKNATVIKYVEPGNMVSLPRREYDHLELYMHSRRKAI